MEREIQEFAERWMKREESLSALCRESGISRKTGYKWVERFKAQGTAGLVARSSRPWSNPRQVGAGVRQRVIALRQEHPRWGPKKLRALLAQELKAAVPAASTLGGILQRAGLIKGKRAGRKSVVRFWPYGQTVAREPNQVWTADYKGHFRTGDGQRCDILTVRDAFSRYVLACELVSAPGTKPTQQVFEQLFARYGQPELIRVDNGEPFGSVGPAGLSRLSVWWLKQGVGVEYSRPAKPQDNGAHERMHRDLKAEVASPPARHRAEQRQRLKQWRYGFNHQRPHEALRMKRPAEVYCPSRRKYEERPRPWVYPGHYEPRRVSGTGEIKWQSRSWFIGSAFAGETVGLLRVSGEVLAVYFQSELLGRLYERQVRRFEPRVRARRAPLAGRPEGRDRGPLGSAAPGAPAREVPAGSPAWAAVSPDLRALTKREKKNRNLSPRSSV